MPICFRVIKIYLPIGISGEIKKESILDPQFALSHTQKSKVGYVQGDLVCLGGKKK